MAAPATSSAKVAGVPVMHATVGDSAPYTEDFDGVAWQGPEIGAWPEVDADEDTVLGPPSAWKMRIVVSYPGTGGRFHFAHNQPWAYTRAEWDALAAGKLGVRRPIPAIGDSVFLGADNKEQDASLHISLRLLGPPLAHAIATAAARGFLFAE